MLKKLAVLSFLIRACWSVEMSLEEKVGQLLIVHFNGEQINEDAKALIQEMHVGGFIYYNWANGLTSPTQVRSLSEGLQNLAQETRLTIPLLIMTDQEGGVVARLTQGFTIFPGNRALGMTGNPEFAYHSAKAMGQELRAVGIDMNLAPVVDVNNNPRNPVIGIRSFGDSPSAVVAFGEQALKGYQEAGIITCLKHFPGHGDVEIDSHEDLPVVKKSLEELSQVELLPFKALASLTDAVMTAHILVPALDPDHCATLSKKTLDFLRGEMGFKGVIIADSLVMQGVLKQCGSIDEAAIEALNAGCDLLLLGGKQLVGNSKIELSVSDIRRIHQSLITAIETGRVSQERLNQAVEKVIQLKKRALPKPILSLDHIRTQTHLALADEIALSALKVIKKESSDLAQKKVAVIAPQMIKDAVKQTTLLHMGQENGSFFFGNLNPSAEEIASILEIAEAFDVVIFCSYNAWKFEKQASLISSLLNKPLILLVVRDPQDADLFPHAKTIISTYSPTAPSLQAACQLLF